MLRQRIGVGACALDFTYGLFDLGNLQISITFFDIVFMLHGASFLCMQFFFPRLHALEFSRLRFGLYT